jgi:nucleoside-diphosphate-sugar epimerase
MTVLVTGAGGLLGSHIVDLLVERGERPRVFLAPGEKPPWPAHAGVELRAGDIGDRDAVAAALRGIDRVLHCAARTGPWGPEAEYQRVNVRALEQLIRMAVAQGVRRIVHVSSITVHGNDVRGIADENAPLRVEPNPYSRSKVAGERLVERLIRRERAPVTIVRPGWIYGPRDAASFARLARTIERGQMLVVGSGENRVPLIFVRDAARGVIDAGDAPGAEGRAYLLVGDEPVTQRQFLGAIARELGVPPPTRTIPYELAVWMGFAAEGLARVAGGRRPPPVMRYGLQLLGGDNRFVVTRARRELGFSPTIGLGEGVRRSVCWYRSRQVAGGRAGVAA